jgi:hypothetical protein
MENHAKGSSRLSPRRCDGWLSRAGTFVASFLIAAAGLLGAESATAQAQAVFQLQDKTNLPTGSYQIYVAGAAAANSLVMQQDGTWLPAPPPAGTTATVPCWRFPQDVTSFSIPPNPLFSGRVYLFVVTDATTFSSCNPTSGNTGLFNQSSAFTYTQIPMNLSQPAPDIVASKQFPAYSFLELGASTTNATIDGSQVDMFAIPVDIQAPVTPGNPAEVGNPWGSAAFPNPNNVVNHASIKDSYTSFVQNLLAQVDCTATPTPAVCGYKDLLIDVTTGPAGSVNQYMIMNPGGYLAMNTSATQTSPLNNAFDNVISTLWSSSGPTLALDTGGIQGGDPQDVPQDVLTSSYITMNFPGTTYSMGALKFTGTAASGNYVAYIFSPADYAAGCAAGGGIPPAYCSNPYSAGVQVFAGMGALGAAVLNGNNLYNLLLAANLLSPTAANYGAVGFNNIVLRLDLLISGAMNRGVTLVNCGSNPIWKCWQDETYWYPTQVSATFPDITQNLLSQWLHTATIGGIPMFVQPPNAVKSAGATPGTGSLMGMAYGFSDDENPTPQVYPSNPQPEVPAKMDGTIVFGTPGTYQVTLSPWVGNTPTLQVTKSGTGSGTVTSSPAGINCGADCSQSFPAGTTVILTANSDAASVFKGWSGGGCSGASTTCTLSLSAAATVNAEFEPQTPNFFLLEVFVSGAGTVIGDPGDIDCGSTCSDQYLLNTVVTLTAYPAPGAVFAGWTKGPCSGSAPTCQVTMSQAQEVSAAFKGVSQYTVTVSAGTGGIVTSKPASIDCGTTCSAGFDAGSQVSLEAQPNRGYRFDHWAGACSGSSTCDLVMTSNQSVQATFAAIGPMQYSLTVHDYGNGTVKSSPSGINCGSVCSASFDQGTEVTLTAVAAQGYDFSGWAGACSGSGACVVKMNDTQSVNVRFTPSAAPVPALGQWGLLALTLLIVTAGWRRRA